jgi:hypothetical protein
MDTEEKEKKPHKKSEIHEKEEIELSEHEPYMYHDVKTILSWHAPGRPYKKRRKEFYLTTLLLALLIEIILFLFSQYLFMFVIISLVFVGFALTAIPPRNFFYKISTEGLMIEDHFYLWQELYDFYFRRIGGVDTLHVRTAAYFPGELILTLGDISREQAKRALLPFLPFREYVRPTSAEKIGDWLYKNFPLERV